MQPYIETHPVTPSKQLQKTVKVRLCLQISLSSSTALHKARQRQRQKWTPATTSCVNSPTPDGMRVQRHVALTVSELQKMPALCGKHLPMLKKIIRCPEQELQMDDWVPEVY